MAFITCPAAARAGARMVGRAGITRLPLDAAYDRCRRAGFIIAHLSIYPAPTDR